MFKSDRPGGAFILGPNSLWGLFARVSSYVTIVNGGTSYRTPTQVQKVVVGGLADRRGYVVDYFQKPGQLGEVSDRLANNVRFKALTSVNEIYNWAADCSISWYVLHPDDTVQWPTEILEKPSFQENGFRVFRFDHKAKL